MIVELLGKSSRRNLTFWLVFCLFFLSWQPVKGQDRERFEQRIQNNICPKPITENDISQTNLTPPSIWWAAQRFGGMLLDFWFTCPGERRVYLVVNRQIWNSLNYVEKYSFVNHFGNYSRVDRYNVQVLNPQLENLAAYRCDFTVNPINCNLWVESFGDYDPPALRSRNPKP